MRKKGRFFRKKGNRMTSITTIGSKEEPFPMLANIWDFFSQKGTKTIFVSIGTGNSCLPELDLAEMVGCKILKLDVPSESQKWRDVGDILKSRKAVESTSEFAKFATRKWVLPKNLLIESSLPSFAQGTVDLQGSIIPTRTWSDILTQHCVNSVGLAQEEVHIDILKLENCALESQVLSSLWDSGFRPSLLLIHWSQSPDSSVQTTNLAAQLQMLGYCLIGKEGNRLLYYYTDVNYFELCSWETVSAKYENPLMKELIRSLIPGGQGGVAFPLEKKESE
jgi:hypothetical protein